MTGLPEFNKAAFDAAAKYVESMGWTAVNPYHADPTHEGACSKGTGDRHEHPWECWMKASLCMMLTCEAVLLLPGWENSRGATIEHDLAKQCGMQVSFLGS